MEDKYLLAHRDEELRKLAEVFLAERDEIQTRYLDFTTRWMEKGAIEKDAATFVEETRVVLLELGSRKIASSTR